MNIPTCTACGGEKDAYYGWWCPVCEKPEPEVVKTYNLIKILKYVEASTLDDGYYDRMWSQLCDALEFSNDTIVSWHFPEAEYDSEEFVADTNKLREIFNLTDDSSIQVDISW